jgi:hypothetical protein
MQKQFEKENHDHIPVVQQWHGTFYNYKYVQLMQWLFY